MTKTSRRKRKKNAAAGGTTQQQLGGRGAQEEAEVGTDTEGLEAVTDANDAEALLCPVLHVMMRDPVFVAGSGNTYERCAVERFWELRLPGVPRRDPYTNTELTNHALFTNWDKRREVQGWLAKHPGATPKVGGVQPSKTRSHNIVLQASYNILNLYDPSTKPVLSTLTRCDAKRSPNELLRRTSSFIFIYFMTLRQGMGDPGRAAPPGWY
jgi:hypothetical protein